MPVETLDLSGDYIIDSMTSTEMVLRSPQEVNPNWYGVDLDGSGTTGYVHAISIISIPETITFDLNGTYTIASVTADTITLNDPDATSSDWTDFWARFFPGMLTNNTSAFVSKSTGNWIGPFIIDDPQCALLVANFVAQGGLFKDSGKKQTAFPITIEIEATPVDSDLDPTGSPETFSVTIPGNSKGRDLRAATKVCELATVSRQSVRARRTTNADYSFKGTVVDEVKWEDLYGIAAVDLDDFGNITTVHTRTYATEGALAVKERRLNLLATRIVERPSDTPIASKDAADIFIAICLDPYLGGRTVEELDVAAIRAAVADAQAYFGSDLAGEFNYTFDDAQTSFEEMIGAVAQSVFCTPLRQGSTLYMEFEQATEASTILFNHRNTDPGSQTRTMRFGPLEDNDGIEYEWRDPDNNDAPATIYIPADRSAVNPREVRGVGIRSYEQAYWQAWRVYNKMVYQHTSVEFRALQEAATTARGQRILVADNTRPDTMDGEVESLTGLDLELSQPAPLVGATDYHIFLQLSDGTVEAIPITAGVSDYHVTLGTAPRLDLALGDDLYARTTYEIAADQGARTSAFIVAEKDPDDNFTFTLRAINYSFLYYANDQMELWLDFLQQYTDAGAYRRDGLPQGSAAITSDGTRGDVHNGTGTGDRVDLPAFNSPADYTKAFWVKKNSNTASGSILSSTSTHERIALSSSGTPPTQTHRLTISHNTGTVGLVTWSWGTAWTHVVVTYDAATTTLRVYINGVQQGSGNTAAAQRSTLGPLHATGYDGGAGLNGSLDDVRLYHRALTPAEVLELYRSTLV